MCSEVLQLLQPNEVVYLLQVLHFTYLLTHILRKHNQVAIKYEMQSVHKDILHLKHLKFFACIVMTAIIYFFQKITQQRVVTFMVGMISFK